MIPDLSRLLRLDSGPGGRQRRQPVARRAFDIEQRARSQPLLALEQLGRRAQQVGRERWIEEHDVEELCGTAKKLQCIDLLDARADGGPLGQPQAQLTRGRPVALDEAHLGGAARQRFQAQRAAAGEQIEAARCRDTAAQPVEQGLANAIRGRADLRRRREAKSPPPPGPPDDAQLPRVSRLTQNLHSFESSRFPGGGLPPFSR